MVKYRLKVEYNNKQTGATETKEFDSIDQGEMWMKNRIDQENSLDQSQKTQLKNKLTAGTVTVRHTILGRSQGDTNELRPDNPREPEETGGPITFSDTFVPGQDSAWKLVGWAIIIIVIIVIFG